MLKKLELARQIIEKKSSDIKFNGNRSSVNRDVPCEETDMTKLEVSFHIFAEARTICLVLSHAVVFSVMT